MLRLFAPPLTLISNQMYLNIKKILIYQNEQNNRYKKFIS